MKKKDTGLKDSENNPIMDGDTLLWEYQSEGVEMEVEGEKLFMGCYPGDTVKNMSYEQIVNYEVRKDAAGYFLNAPNGMGVMYYKDTIKCTIKKSTEK